MKAAVLIAAAVVGSLSLASCGDDDDPSIEDLEELFSSSGYKEQTENFLNDNVQVEDAVGGEVSDASCDEPSSTNIGTQYQCVADVEGVGRATFDVEIDAEDSFLVTDFNFE